MCTDILLYGHVLSIIEASDSAQPLTSPGVFIANADGSIVLAIYGIISSDIGSLNDASWLVVTYTLAMCAVQPTVSRQSALHSGFFLNEIPNFLLTVWQVE